MPHIARLFLNGRSQAVRLPAAYRFNSKEVYIRRDETTGDVIISRRPGSWEEFFALTRSMKVPSDFMADRKDASPQKRDIV